MTASLAWSDSDGQQEQIYFSSYVDGNWEHPVQLSEGNSLDYLPSTGKGGDGRTWVVWSSKQNNTISLMYTFRSGNDWTQPRTIDTGMRSNTAVSLVVDQEDVPWIVWAGFDGNDDEIFWSRWVDGQWSQPELVAAANDVPDLLPVLSMDSHGVLSVRWQGFNGEKYVTVSRSFIEGKWQENQGTKRKMALQSKGEGNFIAYPRLPDFVPDPAKAKMHVRQSRK
ncbi:MAG: hypothetical protein K9K37_12780 [Desulfocapsa sp.]|nr:hypothetical protein [Desulfocapsa sp.]